MSDDQAAEIERLRDAAREAIAASSLRSVAHQVGMSPIGLRDWIRSGRAPRAETLRKLKAWDARRAAGARDAEKAAALDALLRDVTGADHVRAREMIRRLVEQLEQVTAARRSERMVPCAWPKCGRIIPANQVETHLQRHVDQESEGPDFS